MTSIRASAPGKVVVSGEYAVLDGAPAIVMAVDRRARVRLSTADGDWHSLSAPGLLDGAIDFRVDFRFDAAGEMTLRDSGTSPGPAIDLSLVARVWKAVGARPDRSLHFDLDTRPFFHETKRLKLGFGSSAALAVALTSALLGDSGRQDVAKRAMAAHRAFQRGRGSGVDIAAAVHGGILAYRATAADAVVPLRWPEGLRYALLWSGRPACTTEKIAKAQQAASGGPAGDAAARLASASAAVLDTWRREDARATLDSLSVYTRVLEAFSVDRDLGIFDAGHRALAEMAGNRPVVYKPCGAGGGDTGIALALEEDDLAWFIAQAEARGFEPLNVTLDTRGVEKLSTDPGQ